MKTKYLLLLTVSSMLLCACGGNNSSLPSSKAETSSSSASSSGESHSGSSGGKTEYTLSFDTEGGSAVESIKFTPGDKIDLRKYSSTYNRFNLKNVGWGLSKGECLSGLDAIIDTTNKTYDFKVFAVYPGIYTGQRLYFGSYPSVRVTDENLIDKLTKDGSEIVTLDGVKYQKYTIDSEFCERFNDGTAPQYGKSYFFEYKPIEWVYGVKDWDNNRYEGRVLKTKNVIDYIISNDYAGYGSTFEESMVCDFLNNDFSEHYFNNEEKNIIMHNKFMKEGIDVYLMSESDAYGPNHNLGEDYRKNYATDYAIARGVSKAYDAMGKHDVFEEYTRSMTTSGNHVISTANYNDRVAEAIAYGVSPMLMLKLDQDEPVVVDVTITFDSQGGSSVEPRVIKSNEAIGELPVPTKEGCDFLGWFKADGTSISPSSMFSEDTTIYARWNENFNIEYNLVIEGATLDITDADRTYSELSPVTFKNPTRTYRYGEFYKYTFAGWYLDDKYSGEAVTSTEGLSGDLSLFAKWETEAVTKTIVYVLNGGVNDSRNPTEFTADDGIIPLYPATKEADGQFMYEFENWTDGKGTGSGKPVTVIDPSAPLFRESNEIKLYAKYKQYIKVVVHLPEGITIAKSGAQIPEKMYKGESLNLSTVVLENIPAHTNFDGWYKDQEFKYGISTINVGTTSTDDAVLNLYPKFTAVASKSITLKLSIIGLEDKVITYYKDDQFVELPVVSKTNNTFIGYNPDLNFSSYTTTDFKYSKLYDETKDAMLVKPSDLTYYSTLYPIFEKCDIKYVLDESIYNIPSYYDKEDIVKNFNNGKQIQTSTYKPYADLVGLTVSNFSYTGYGNNDFCLYWRAANTYWFLVYTNPEMTIRLKNDNVRLNSDLTVYVKLSPTRPY